MTIQPETQTNSLRYTKKRAVSLATHCPLSPNDLPTKFYPACSTALLALTARLVLLTAY